MKSHLSHILPVWKACDTLGRPTVQRIVASLLQLRLNTSPANRKQDSEELHEQIDLLVDSLFFRPPSSSSASLPSEQAPPQDPLSPPSSSASLHNDNLKAEIGRVPAPIADAWKQWLTAGPLALDKPTLLRFLVPPSAQPYSGPSGHMGLFDCFIYTLQGHAPSSSASYYGGATSQLVWVPDVLIFLAVCKAFRNLQDQAQHLRRSKPPPSSDDESNKSSDSKSKEPDRSSTEHAERVIWTMAVLAYRMYDSYQKKGSVARDTVHRFLTDVHGEDSFKEPKAQAVLDIVFDDRDHAPGWLQATVSETQFCKRILSTTDLQYGRPHLLLDWMSYLATSMIPAEEIPHSVAAYLDTMDHQPRPLSDAYALADHRLFEIKRRFHSLVQSSSPVIVQGDPMGSSSPSSTATSTNASSAPSDEQPQGVPPKHSIREAAFAQALSTPNAELGHGGYMPAHLARLVFRAGCRTNNSAGNVDENSEKLYWGLYHVVQFGCVAVRHNTSLRGDPELPLMRFLFGTFQQQATAVSTGADERQETAEELAAAEDAKRVLTRAQVAGMLLALIEYTDFRLKADAPINRDEEEDDDAMDSKSGGEGEAKLLNARKCTLLGLMKAADKKTVTLGELVDITMKDTAKKDQMSFDEFCTWNKTRISDDTPRTRLSHFIMELRLVASVLFGIPPTLASMEVTLIAEIERRHRSRYPQSDVSRRGPRGTVWYIIDAAWFGSWATLVEQAAGTVEDQNDGRGDKNNTAVRGIRRISNTSLLVENGSLALRQDIRWKHDYEILPPLAWSALQAWYDGGPPIHRTVVRFISSASHQQSPHSSAPRVATENEIELYPLFVTIYMCDVTSRGEARPFQQNYQLSRVSPVGIPLVQLCRELDVDPDSARLWIMGSDPGAVVDEGTSGSDDWILSLDMNIIEQRKRRGTKDSHVNNITLLLEIKDSETGLWPRGVDGKEWSFREKEPAERNISDLGDGIVGLYNMG